MKKLTTSLLATAGAVALSSVLAAPSVTSAQQIVTVTHNDGGTQVGTQVNGQPLVSGSVDGNGICVGFSYQTGACPVGPID